MYPGADIRSDHNPTVATMRVKLKKLRSPQIKFKVDWKSVNETECREYQQYIEDVSNNEGIKKMPEYDYTYDIKKDMQ
jgi:hypothetical protein